MERQRWWGHLTQIFWQQPSRYYERAEGRQRVVPTDESSSLHVEKPCREAGNVTYQDRHSTFEKSVSDAIRRGAEENEVQKYEENLTGAWRRMSTLR